MNAAAIALIIVTVAITTGVITWLVATESQAPVQQASEDSVASGWKNFSFGNVSFKYPQQVCVDSANCQSVRAMKNGDAINIGQYLDSNEPSLTIYYVENIDLKGAEKYLQGKYGNVNPISWIVEKNNADIKLADHFGGFNQVSGGVLSYAAYSEKLKTLVSFGYAPACVIDCDKDIEFLSSIKLGGVKVYNGN